MLITIAISVAVIALVAYWKWDSLDQLKDVAYFVGCVIAVSAVTGWILSERVQTLQARADAAEQSEATARTAENERQTAQANEAAAKANEGFAQANLDIEDRKKEIVQLSLTLEGERSGRAALEKKLSERLVPFHEVRDAVGKFEGMQFSLVSARDDESKQAAAHLGATLEYAGWKATKWTNASGDLPVGIFVEANDVRANEDDHSLDAKDALIAWIEKSGILVHSIPPRRELTQGTIRILVGRSERLAPAAEVRVKYETILNKGPEEPSWTGDFDW